LRDKMLLKLSKQKANLSLDIKDFTSMFLLPAPQKFEEPELKKDDKPLKSKGYSRLVHRDVFKDDYLRMCK